MGNYIKFVFFSSLSFFHLSCSNHRDSGQNIDYQKKQRLLQLDKKNDWVDSKNKHSLIYSNRITLQDGQTSEAGLSFLIKMDEKILLTSCKHILGTAGGFNVDIPENSIDIFLKKWEVKKLSGGNFVETGGRAERRGYCDVFYLNLGKIDTSKMVILNPTVDVTKDKKYFLIGIDILGNGKEKKIPLTYIGENGQSLFLFNNDNDEILEGSSGGPVITENGNVIGTLKGFTTMADGKKVILVQKIVGSINGIWLMTNS